jgi:hypothetical protein
VISVHLMMHLTFDEKSLLLGDEAANQVVEYAAALARAHSADTVRLTAYGADGDKIEATLLLDEGAPLMIETSNTDLPEPDNDATLGYIRERMAQLSVSPNAVPIPEDDVSVIADFEHHFDMGSDGPPTT